MARFYGIDLGTTNTVVAYCTTQQNGNILLEILKIRQRDFHNKKARSEEILPSIIYLDDMGNVQIGKEAKEFKDTHHDASRYIFNTKLRMGYNDLIPLKDKEYLPLDVAKLILEKCHQDIHFMSRGNYDDRIVITVPASFGKDEREATFKAAKLAGFKEITIFAEPHAALLAYIYENSQMEKDFQEIDLKTPKNILTIDLGGGTCDICFIEAKKDEDKFEIRDLKPYQRINLGGFNFDKAIAEYILNHKMRPHLNINDLDTEIINALITYSELAKEDISLNIENDISAAYEKVADYENGLLDDQKFDHYKYEGGIYYDNRHFLITVTKKEIDQVIDRLIYRGENIISTKEESQRNINIEECIRRTVDLENDRIDYILFTGGMSKYITLRKKIYEMVKAPIISPSDPMLAVAKGAALKNVYDLVADSYDFNLMYQNVTTEAILLDVFIGLPIVLIKKGEVIKKHDIKQIPLQNLKTTSPTGLKIGLFEGEDEFDSNLKKLNYVEIKFHKIKRIGTPFIIKYAIDENRMYDFWIEFADGEGYKITSDAQVEFYNKKTEGR